MEFASEFFSRLILNNQFTDQGILLDLQVNMIVINSLQRMWLIQLILPCALEISSQY